MNRSLQEILSIESLVQARVATNLAGDGVVVHHRPPAVPRTSAALPIVEANRTVAEVNEKPPDVAIPRDAVFLRGTLDHLACIIRAVVSATRRRLPSLHAQYLDRPNGLAPEEIRRRRCVSPFAHALEQDLLRRTRDLRQPMHGPRGSLQVRWREQNDADRRRRRVPTVSEKPPVCRPGPFADRPMSAMYSPWSHRGRSAAGRAG